MPDYSAFLTARVVVVVVGVGVVVAAMWLCRLVTRDRTATVVAGLLVAVHPILVRNSAVGDVPTCSRP